MQHSNKNTGLSPRCTVAVARALAAVLAVTSVARRVVTSWPNRQSAVTVWLPSWVRLIEGCAYGDGVRMTETVQDRQ